MEWLERFHVVFAILSEIKITERISELAVIEITIKFPMAKFLMRVVSLQHSLEFIINVTKQVNDSFIKYFEFDFLIWMRYHTGCMGNFQKENLVVQCFSR